MLLKVHHTGTEIHIFAQRRIGSHNIAEMSEIHMIIVLIILSIQNQC